MRLIWQTCALLISGLAAIAVPVTANFSGTVNNDPFGVFGAATFTGQYTYDSAIAQVLNTPNSGGYSGSGPGYSMSVSFLGTVGGLLDGILFLADTLNISVNNNIAGPLDQYLVTGTSTTDPNLFIELTLEDFTATALSGIALPAPSLTGFQIRKFSLFAGTPSEPIEVQGAVETLTSNAAVPEPGTISLMALGIGCLWVRFRRRV